MKLFVWVGPVMVPYGGSLLFAVAETVEQARELACAQMQYYSHGKFAYECDMSSIGVTLGEPARVLDLPCAEWHEWSE